MSEPGAEHRAALREFAAAAAGLAPGASTHAHCLLGESDDSPVERTVRHELGAAGDAVDVLIAVHTVDDPAEHHFRRALAGASGAGEAERSSAALRAHGADRLVDCTLIAARVTEARPGVTLRVAAAADASVDDLTGVLSRATQPPAITAANLERVVPRLSPHTRLRVTHGVSEQGWTPLGCTITLDWPVRRTLQAGTNLAMLMGACDGRTSARALFAGFAAGGGNGDDLTESRFADVLSRLVVDGYLMLDDPPTP